MTTTNYQNYMNAFAELVAEALFITQNCFRPTIQCAPQAAECALQQLREAYNQRIKPLGTNEEDRDKAMESALGQYYGALVTHLTAITKKWDAISEGRKNALIDMDEQRILCANEALSYAQKYSEAANAYAARLWQAELDLRSRVHLLVKQIELYAMQIGLNYSGKGGQEVLGYAFVQLSRVQFKLSFGYHDGVDVINGSLDELLSETKDRAYVRSLAELTLGDKAKLWRDYETVEATTVSIPLVKISELRS